MSISDLPNLSPTSQFGGFGKYMLSCHNGHGNQAKVCECVSTLDGPFDIAGTHAPGDLDYQVDFYPVFRASAAYHQIGLIEILSLDVREHPTIAGVFDEGR